MFRKYDIRGIAMGEEMDLSKEVVYLIGKATGTYLQRNGHKHMAVGRDGRITSPELQQTFIEGVLSTGLDVTNIGLAVTPMIYFTSCQEKFDCAANITGSHNPKEYNGIKLVGDGAHSICGEELQEIYQMILKEDFLEGKGEYNEESVWENYKKALISQVDIKKPMKVVIDTANGVAGAFVSDLIADLPNVEAEYLYLKVDGNFPNHEANPEKEANMEEAKAKVLELGADLGFGFDGDGDRVGLVDEKAGFYSADLLLLQLARDLLKRRPGAKIIFDVKTSKVVENDIIAKGGLPIRYAVGHSLIEQKMRQEDALLAGEISGHVFFAENYYGFDDAFLAMLKLIEIASKYNSPFSALFHDVPQVVNTPEIKIPCSDERKFRIVEQVVDHFKAAGYDTLSIDGAFVSLDPNTWGIVRCSNTTPNLTLRFEALSQEDLNKVKDLFKEVLSAYEDLDVSVLA